MRGVLPAALGAGHLAVGNFFVRALNRIPSLIDGWLGYAISRRLVRYLRPSPHSWRIPVRDPAGTISQMSARSSHFTVGQSNVLRVVGDECRARGTCSLHLD